MGRVYNGPNRYHSRMIQTRGRGGGGGEGLSNKGRYGCEGPGIRNFRVNFCPGIRFWEVNSARALGFWQFLTKNVQ